MNHCKILPDSYNDLVEALDETTAILERIFADSSINNDDGTPRFDEYDIAEWKEAITKAKGE